MTKSLIDAMKKLPEFYEIVGHPLPYRTDDSDISFLSIEFGVRELKLSLQDARLSFQQMEWQIWEQTIHEIEVLSSSLRVAASEQFPKPIEVQRPASVIGPRINLCAALQCELGYSLNNPSASRATFFCSSRNWGVSNTSFGVRLGLAMGGAFTETIITASSANTFADWLDGHIERLTTHC